MQTKKIVVVVTLVEDMLGTKAANEDIFADYIASKAPNDDLRKQELETAEHREEAGTSIFHRNQEGNLIIWDYQVKGFLKEAGNIMRQCFKAESDKAKNPWTSAKSKIDNFVFVYPRMIDLGKSKPDSICERPLRVETMQGPRVAVARSEAIAAGAQFACEIEVMENSPITIDMIKQCLDYGKLKGLGQWRNSGKGRFIWEEVSK